MSRLQLMACAASAVLLFSAGTSAAQTADANAPAAAAVAPSSPGHPSIGTFGFDMDGMDTSVRPGQDFNAYASGNYLRNTPIPADKSSYGAFHILNDRAQIDLKTLIDESVANPSANRSEEHTSELQSRENLVC